MKEVSSNLEIAYLVDKFLLAWGSVWELLPIKVMYIKH